VAPAALLGVNEVELWPPPVTDLYILTLTVDLEKTQTRAVTLLR